MGASICHQSSAAPPAAYPQAHQTSKPVVNMAAVAAEKKLNIASDVTELIGATSLWAPDRQEEGFCRAGSRGAVKQ